MRGMIRVEHDGKKTRLASREPGQFAAQVMAMTGLSSNSEMITGRAVTHAENWE